MALDEPMQNDVVTEVDGIRLICDYTVQKYAKTLSIACRDTVYGKKLVVTKMA